jgi:hypothetical protein
MSKRDEVAEILERMVADGLDGPRDLDVALDAIFCTLELDDDGENPARLKLAEWEQRAEQFGWVRDDGTTLIDTFAMEKALGLSPVQAKKGFPMFERELETLRRLDPMSVEAIGAVIRERLRQIEDENWTPSHDDEHDGGEMAAAASCGRKQRRTGRD